MLYSVIFYGVVTLAAALLAALAGLPSLFATPIEDRGIVSVLAAASLASIVIVGGARLERYGWYAKMADFLRDAVRSLLGPKAGAPDAFLVALASSIGEETFFRGFCQPGLARLFREKVLHLEPRPAILLAIAATAVSFTLLHPPLKRELRPWTAFALAMGVIWGLLAAWSGSLAGPVLSHFLVNFFNLRRLLARESDGC